ncbi:MAG: hypothetical protein ACK55I_22390, partial [bacterium]
MQQAMAAPGIVERFLSAEGLSPDHVSTLYQACPRRENEAVLAIAAFSLALALALALVLCRCCSRADVLCWPLGARRGR